MAKQILAIGDTGAQLVSKFNSNFDGTFPIAENCTDGIAGILLKGTDRFIHDYPGTAIGDTVYDLAGHNLFIGKLSGNFTLTGHANVGIGDRCLQDLTTGSLNTALGNFAGANITSGLANTAIGRAALWYNLTATGNTAVGESALERTIADENTGVGINAGMYITTGIQNQAFGYNALFGDFANAGVTGNENVAIGTGSLYCLSSGSYNIAIGGAAMQTMLTGSYNIAIGQQAMNSGTGSNNVAIGKYALYTTTGDNNTAIGFEALRWNPSGSGCVALGYYAGVHETGSNKLFIDNAARTNEADARIKALVYGIFDVATANQLLTVNGNINALEGYKIAGAAGVSGTITSASTVTVVKGIITNIA